MAITSWSPEVEKDMEEVVKPEYGICEAFQRNLKRCSECQIPGINSFKFFLAYSGVFMVRDEEFYQGKHSNTVAFNALWVSRFFLFQVC